MRKNRNDKNSKTRLGLSKETLRSLTEEQSLHIEGGSSGHRGELTRGSGTRMM